jgi:hypothetical protein
MNHRRNYSTILGTMKSRWPGGRVAQGVVVRERRADFVGARDIDHRHGVGGRLDAGHVEFLQFFDVAEDAAELRAEFFFLVGRERSRARCATYLMSISADMP